jgi:DNA-binding response OmpR family regulator
MTRILVVEDNETNCTQLAVLLGGNGCDVEALDHFGDILAPAVAPEMDLVLFDELPAFRMTVPAATGFLPGHSELVEFTVR